MAQYTFDTLKDLEIAGISLPSGYTKLKYIENKGNASTYIDTNYVANANTTLRALVSINTDGYNSMGYIGTYRYGFNLNGSGLFSYVNTSNYYYAVKTLIGQRRLIEIDNITKSVSLDGVVIGTMAAISYPIGGTYLIGRLNNYNGEYFNGKIYYNEFLENGISVQKLIPCEDGNGNIGMYDVVTETFFANQGTNPFISGGTAPTITPVAGDTATVTSTGGVYKYEGDAWQLWYSIIPPLVFRGMTFEQPDYWQIPEMVFRGMTFEQPDYWQTPEMVFRGFSFEEADKKLLDTLFFAQS